jgi:hypothetical protein
MIMCSSALLLFNFRCTVYAERSKHALRSPATRTMVIVNAEFCNDSCTLLKKLPNVQVSDTTKADSSNLLVS